MFSPHSRVVLVLVSSQTNSLSTTSGSLPELLHELAECEKNSCNAIIRGLQESSSTDACVRMADNIKSFSDITIPLFLSLPSNSKLFRLGRTSAGNSRPIYMALQASI